MVRFEEKRLSVLESQKGRKPGQNLKQTLLGNQHLSNLVRYDGFLKEIPCTRSFPAEK